MAMPTTKRNNNNVRMRVGDLIFLLWKDFGYNDGCLSLSEMASHPSLNSSTSVVVEDHNTSLSSSPASPLSPVNENPLLLLLLILHLALLPSSNMTSSPSSSPGLGYRFTCFTFSDLDCSNKRPTWLAAALDLSFAIELTIAFVLLYARGAQCPTATPLVTAA